MRKLQSRRSGGRLLPWEVPWNRWTPHHLAQDKALVLSHGLRRLVVQGPIAEHCVVTRLTKGRNKRTFVYFNGIRAPCTWDTRASLVAADLLMRIVEEDGKAKQVVVKKEEVEEILCEGILKSNPEDDPPAITQVSMSNTGFREPTDFAGCHLGKFERVDYAHIPGMSEPMIIGCPVRDQAYV